MEEFDNFEEKLLERDDAGFGGEVPDSDRIAMETKKKDFQKEVVDAFINTNAARRRRRTGLLNYYNCCMLDLVFFYWNVLLFVT